MYVILARPLKSPAGNLIAAPGRYEAEWVNGRVGSAVRIATPLHYAGISSASFRLRKTDRVEAMES